MDKINSSNDCQIIYSSLDTSELFKNLISTIEKQPRTERNLLFIDPYGYKPINPIAIKTLLSNKRTEILLFLPISFMHRFKNISLESEQACYQALKDFITMLFPEGHSIYDSQITSDEFIRNISEGFSFNQQFYCVSRSIERSRNNLFAVFFMTSHIYGLERMLSVKWAEDDTLGTGYRIKSPQGSLFEQEEKQEVQNLNYDWLARNLHDFIERSGQITNLELYEFTLRNGFLPKHTNQVLKDWKEAKTVKVYDADKGNFIENPRSFYNRWEEYKTQKARILIRIK